MVSRDFELVRSRLPHFDSPYFEGFWGSLREVLERILLSLVDMIFAFDFCIGFVPFLMDLVSLGTRKSEPKTRRVLQNQVFRMFAVESTCEAN